MKRVVLFFIMLSILACKQEIKEFKVVDENFQYKYKCKYSAIIVIRFWTLAKILKIEI